MPMQRKLYPDDWDEIALAIKEAANWHCQSCGKPCRKPGETVEQLAERLEGTIWEGDMWEYHADEESGEWGYVPKPQRFTLTVAHLNHVPSDCSPDNLRALCAPCHCRYDTHPTQRAIKRRLKQERNGQPSLTLE